VPHKFTDRPAHRPPDEGSPEAAAAAAYAASQAYYYGGDPQAFYEPARPDRYHTQYVTRSDGAAFTFKETSANIPATPRQLHRSESSFRRAPVSPVSSPRGTGRFRVRAGAYDQIYDARAASSIGDGDDDDDSDEEEDDVARLIEALSGLDASERAQRKRRDAWLASPTGSRSFGADDSRSWEVAAAAAASAREDRGDVDADAPVHKSQLFAQNAIRRAPLVSIPTPPSLHPLVTQTSSDMIGAALKQELS